MGHSHKTVNELVFSRNELEWLPLCSGPRKMSLKKSALSKGYYALNNEIMANIY